MERFPVIYWLIRKILFRFDPELIHHFSFYIFSKFPKIAAFVIPGIKRDGRFKAVGRSMTWDFPIGIAAGLDKDATAFEYLWRLGFGAIEIGTVTPRPQKGNEKPRLFRLIKEKSLRNHMGFPNDGSEKILTRLKKKKGQFIGVNLGKNSDSSPEIVYKDYQFLYQVFKADADYLVINVSCPNVKNLTNLQSGEGLDDLLTKLGEVRSEGDPPLFIKIGPDQSEEQLQSIVESAKKYNLAGIVATNTLTIEELGIGGISGELLREKARSTRNRLLKLSAGDLDIIGVGGFSDFDDVWEFLQNGGKFVQVYTSFIYKGPGILREMRKKLEQKLT